MPKYELVFIHAPVETLGPEGSPDDDIPVSYVSRTGEAPGKIVAVELRPVREGRDEDKAPRRKRLPFFGLSN